MAISLPDARQLSDEVLEALRLRALHGCELGFTEADVAELLGVARETVSRWFSAYRSGGLDALPHERTGRPLGSGRTLSDLQAAHLQELLDAHGPEDLGIAAAVWTRRAVQDLIRNQYDIDMPLRTVGAYLRRWGYTAKRPRRHDKHQDPEEVQKWLDKTYPAIEKRAKEEDAEIHFCDETGVQADAHPCYGYARKGQAATMKVPDPHIHYNVVTALSNNGKLHFMTYKETMTGARFLVFLKRLVRRATKKIFLLVDRLKVHTSRAVADWLAAHKDQIELFLMPRRAPELQPVEYFNNDLKGNVHAAGLPNNQQELRSGIQAFLQRLVHLPEHVMNYFQHPAVQYAAGK
jgi:transposase